MGEEEGNGEWGAETGSKEQGKGDWGLGRRLNLSDNCSNFMSHDINRCFYAI